MSTQIQGRHDDEYWEYSCYLVETKQNVDMAVNGKGGERLVEVCVIMFISATLLIFYRSKLGNCSNTHWLRVRIEV
jgi:hypothetical protein